MKKNLGSNKNIGTYFLVLSLEKKLQNILRQINFLSLVIFLILSIIINIKFAYSYSNHNSDPKLLSLKETIIALDITRKKSIYEKENLLIKQKTSYKKTINDYSVFINFLSLQIQNYCNSITHNFGSEYIDDLPCHISEQGGNKIRTNQNQIKTASEEIESLDNEFINSMGDFDEMLLKEDELARNIGRSSEKSNSGQKSSSNGSSSGVENKQAGNEKSEKNSEKEQTKTTGADKSSEQTGSESLGKQKKSSKISSREKRKLDKIDDDIVARQLKEAAEKESDPKLKEKLWNEYYNYKKNRFKK